MKNENPLLVPELREMLEVENTKVLRDFCETGHAAIVTELISAFYVRTTWEVFGHQTCRGAKIFSHPNDDFMFERLKLCGGTNPLAF